MTLDEALQVVAESSFYEDKQVYFAAGEWHADGDTSFYSYEDVTWTHDDVLDFGTETPPLDHSGLMMADQVFSVSAQIRRYLPQAVEALERGHSVIFTYQPVSVGILDEDGDDDTLAGWVLIAEDQGPMEFEVCKECAGMIVNGLEAPVQTLPGYQVVGDEADLTQCDNCGGVFPLWVEGFECSTR